MKQYIKNKLCWLAIATMMSIGSLTASETGIASHYSVRTNGTVTASGVRLDDSKLTAAHKTLPFGTLVKVTDIKTGKFIVVKITDRGPYIKGRIIDLSIAAAKSLGIHSRGIARVKVDKVTN